MKYKNNKRFCEVTSWWNMSWRNMYYNITNQVSPHFFYYPAELMLKKGFDVEVLTKLFPERDESEYEVNNGIKVRRFQKSSVKFCPTLLKYMLKNDYSLIHQHTVAFLEDYVPWIVSRIKKTPIVFTSHNPGLPRYENRQDIKARIVKTTLKIRDSVIFIAFTEFQANLYRSFGIKNIKIIPHGIDPAVFDVPKNYEIAEKYGLEENNILCVGNIDPRKGQHLLVGCMPEILKNHPKTMLLLVGRTFKDYQRGYLKMLKSKIEKMGLKRNVAFLNDVSKDELIHLYLLSDVFAFPTDYEIFGIVFLEAMAAGLPIISTDRPYIKEILQDGDAGILVKREQKEFEEGIISLLDDEGLRKRLSNNGKKAVEEKYHLGEVVNQLWDLYRSLIEG